MNHELAEYTAVALIFVLLVLHAAGYNSLVDSLLITIVSSYLGIDIVKVRKLIKVKRKK